MNGIQWALLSNKKIKDKMKIIYFSTTILYIIIPFALLISIVVFRLLEREIVSENLHMVEAVYNSGLCLLVILVIIFSWYKLIEHMKQILSSVTFQSAERKLTIQMVLYVVFFTSHSVFLLITSIWYIITGKIENNNKQLIGPSIFFFLHTSFGDCPLVY
jgi:hypothetical protein